MMRSTKTLRVNHGDEQLERNSRELTACLATLHGLLKQLLELAGHKMRALRAADPRALNRGAVSEAALLEEVQKNRRERNAVLARLAQDLQWPGVRSARLSRIAERIPEPCASSIRARIAGLRECAAALEEKNNLAALVARGLQSHVRGVFADLAQATSESVVYGPEGKHEQTTVRSWVDAVG